MSKIIRDLLYERGQLSLTRVLALAGFAAFLVGSFVLLWKGTRWDNYETFATFAGGGGAATQLANKFLNNKYNSNPGESYDKGGAGNGNDPA